LKGLLLNALAVNKPLEMIYTNEQGQLSQRIIVLEELADTHIKALCKLRNQRRVFKLSNTLSIRLTKEKRKRVD
jgi:predicted DNA-binding transcriptional regulator YafY